MNRNDWIGLLAASLNTDERFAVEVLDARVPALCPDCHGEGFFTLPEWEGQAVVCDECPTVEQVLAAGMAAVQAMNSERTWEAVYYAVEAALRGENP